MKSTTSKAPMPNEPTLSSAEAGFYEGVEILRGAGPLAPDSGPPSGADFLEGCHGPILGHTEKALKWI